MQHRRRLVEAALTLVQAWVAHGMPYGNDVLGSFDAWAQVHGGILEVAGVPGFLTNRHDSEAITTSDDAAWTALCDLWWETFHDDNVTASDLFPLIEGLPEFPLGGSPSDRGQRVSFGASLRANRDRIFNGRQIRFVGTVQRAAQYRLVSTGEVPF